MNPPSKNDRPVIETFYTKGSPLKGLIVPRHWAQMDRRDRAKELMRMGVADGEAEAARLVGEHAAAVKAASRRFGVTPRRSRNPRK